MKIGLDFDGVIAYCGDLKSRQAKVLYGADIPPGKLKKEVVLEEGLLSLEQYRHIQQSIYHGRELGLQMDPVQGALTRIQNLIGLGHEIVVITSRELDACEIAREWMALRGLELELTGVGYGNSKAGIATGLDIYVDDDLSKLAPFVEIVPHLFLFSWGYSERLDESGIARRVSSWDEFYLAILDLEYGAV